MNANLDTFSETLVTVSDVPVNEAPGTFEVSVGALVLLGKAIDAENEARALRIRTTDSFSHTRQDADFATLDQAGLLEIDAQSRAERYADQARDAFTVTILNEQGMATPHDLKIRNRQYNGLHQLWQSLPNVRAAMFDRMLAELRAER